MDADLTQLMLLSSVTAMISFTITETVVFEPSREWIELKSKFFGKLFKCGFCFGVWMALSVEVEFRLQLFDTYPILNYLMTAFVIAWWGAFQWVTMCCLLKFAGK